MSAPIREATAGDLPTLRAIQLASLAEPWPELLRAAVGGPPLLLVYDDAGPSGYALALAGDSGSSMPEPGDPARAPNGADGSREERTAYLVELAVAAPRRGEGRGSALVSALADRLRADGYERLTATVRATDERALAFYRGRGFDPVERLPGHYESGDGHLLALELLG